MDLRSETESSGGKRASEIKEELLDSREIRRRR